MEFVDQATLSPPEGYKDTSLIDSALSGALSNHVFGAQHIQQLQVIQRLQQQRAAMLAARAAAANANSQSNNSNVDPQGVCTECAECAECAAAKLAELEAGEFHEFQFSPFPICRMSNVDELDNDDRCETRACLSLTRLESFIKINL